MAIFFALIAAASLQSSFLEDFKGQYRILIGCPGVDEMNISYAQSEGFRERDVIRISLEQSEFGFMMIPVRDQPQSSDGSTPFLLFQTINREKVRTASRVARCEDDVAYALIGKDGEVKKRWASSPSVEEIFETIDAMPMRQQEMLNRD